MVTFGLVDFATLLEMAELLKELWVFFSCVIPDKSVKILIELLNL